MSKRPMMGQASSEYADMIILTSDDPRDEQLADINQKVKQGIGSAFENNKNLFEIPDRREAIKFAIKSAQPGDFLVLTGKGHEPTIALPTGEAPWNEKQVVLEELQNLEKASSK
jgi:UDP-N-acetylmuramoyl-L-alanyl-D-glutamate--2,6-diaminopimelate ligase